MRPGFKWPLEGSNLDYLIQRVRSGASSTDNLHESDDPTLVRLKNFEDAFVERKSTSDTRDLLKTAVAFANSVPVGYPAILFYGVTDKALQNSTLKYLNNLRLEHALMLRKRAEQEREILRADLGHVNRVSMLGELAASLSHELKQPITASITNAKTCMRWLERDEPAVEQALEATKRIVKDGSRATEIIDRLRSLYKKSPPQRELVDVNEIVRAMLVLMRGEATRYLISMRTELAADLPKITADHVQIQQVFMNLMLNGIEATFALPKEPVDVGSMPEPGRACPRAARTVSQKEPSLPQFWPLLTTSRYIFVDARDPRASSIKTGPVERTGQFALLQS